MSLINQALRKAQQDRTPNKMPADGDQAGSAQRFATQQSSQSGMKPAVIVGLIVTVALLVGVIAGLSVVLFKDSGPSAPVVAQQAPAVQSLQPVTPPPTTTPATPAQPKAPVTDANTPSVLNELRAAREAAEAKAATEAAATAEAERIAAAKPSQDIIDWLSQAKVTGVRLSPKGNKVILNGKAYEIGETVHFGLGLNVLVIEEKRILFVDKIGKKYMKRL
jgi:flagellar basal body-associated protein FliL